ncbi:DUF397 domain-containing protein [Micromonospora orduensis]|uniref:DUF397 domain-containing protein n=1 Tax=Micromonospora orduensis TaxID=1420891 RepID=UPI001FCCA031|nr:DUF397 domain-containing protein [Micromonospora orduensis]
MHLSGAVWRTSTRSNSECVEMADNPPGIVGVRNSKDPTGPVLMFAPAAWRASAAAGRPTA